MAPGPATETSNSIKKKYGKIKKKTQKKNSSVAGRQNPNKHKATEKGDRTKKSFHFRTGSQKNKKKIHTRREISVCVCLFFFFLNSNKKNAIARIEASGESFPNPQDTHTHTHTHTHINLVILVKRRCSKKKRYLTRKTAPIRPTSMKHRQ